MWHTILALKRVVIDTNILISGLNWFGNPYTILRKAYAKEFIFVISYDQFDEFRRVIEYDKFDFDIEDRDRMGSFVFDNALFIRPMERLDIVKDDPSDNMILECALEGKADFIVSGDSHLLELKRFRGMPIPSPREFPGSFSGA